MVKRSLALFFVVLAVAMVSAERGPWFPIGKGPASMIGPTGIPIPACTGDGSGISPSVCPAPGADNNIVQASPSPSTFVIKAGYHRFQAITPRSNDVFIGETGAIVSGARVLRSWTSTTCHSIPCWYVDNQTQQGGSAEFPGNTNPTTVQGCAGNTGYKPGTNNPEGSGNGVSGYFNCFRPEDVYFDGVFKYHCWNWSLCTASNAHGQCLFTGAPDCGGWYLDYNGSGAFPGSTQYRLYVFDDPTSHNVEASVTPAFTNPNGATGVTLAGVNRGTTIMGGYLVIENYASPYDQQMISCGPNWLCDHIEGRGAHYTAIDNNANSISQYCFVHHNGTFGFHGGGGQFGNVIVQNNEISFNNYQASLDIQWGSGGTKWAASGGLIVRNNYSHDNYGPGFWTDESNFNSKYISNRIDNNYRAGILHEISYSGEITNNTFTGNGSSFYSSSASGSYPSEGCIAILNSGGTSFDIGGNTCTDNYYGIGLMEDQRNVDPAHFYGLGTSNTKNVFVHDNTINMLNSIPSNSGGGPVTTPQFGAWTVNTSLTGIWSTAQNNKWKNNHYHFGNTNQHFQWQVGSGPGSVSDSTWLAISNGDGTFHDAPPGSIGHP